MKIDDLIDLNVWDEVAVFGLVGHVDHELSLEGDLVTVGVEDLVDVLTLGCTNQST